MANLVAGLYSFSRFLVIVLLATFLSGATAPAWGQISGVVTPDCTNADLTATLHVFRPISHTQIIAVDYRNIRPTACLMRPDGGPQQGPILTLEPNAIAHTSFRWQTEPTTLELKCHDQSFRTISVNRSPNGLVIVSATMLPPVCSEVQYDPYFAGPFAPDWPEDAGTPPAPSTIILAAAKQTFFQGERVSLKLTIDGLSPLQPMSKYHCPVMFRTLHNPTGFTRIDEVPMINGQECRLPQEKDGSLSKHVSFDKVETAGSGYEQTGAQTFSYSLLNGYSRQGEFVLSNSNSVTLHFDNPAMIPRKWGNTQNGVRVDLTLDKLTYTLGEEIPLHIAAQVVSAEQPVYGERFGYGGAFMSDFAGAFQLVIIDDDGPLPLREGGRLIDFFGGSSGPIICTGQLEQSKVYTLERSAQSQGFLPERPGKYQIYIQWSPYRTKYTSCDDVPRTPDGPWEQPFVTVTSYPLTILITGEKAADGIPDVPEYIAWKHHFALLDTSFGEQTALLDKATGLEWLHVNLTTRFNEEQLRKSLQSEDNFAGWRFATKDEVRQFLANFTATTDGVSTNPGIERKLQRLLGGPTDTVRNEQTGWSRRDTAGRIAGLTPALPEEVPGEGCPVLGLVFQCTPSSRAGFDFYYAYIGEDTQNGTITTTINPFQRGWTIADSTLLSGGFFLVRDKR